MLNDKEKIEARLNVEDCIFCSNRFRKGNTITIYR